MPPLLNSEFWQVSIKLVGKIIWGYRRFCDIYVDLRNLHNWAKSGCHYKKPLNWRQPLPSPFSIIMRALAMFITCFWWRRMHFDILSCSIRRWPNLYLFLIIIDFQHNISYRLNFAHFIRTHTHTYTRWICESRR